MDPITHAALGAGLCALAAPREQRRFALILGAVAGNLPDLDYLVLWFQPDPVLQVTQHRSFSHSLLVLPRSDCPKPRVAQRQPQDRRERKGGAWCSPNPRALVSGLA